MISNKQNYYIYFAILVAGITGISFLYRESAIALYSLWFVSGNPTYSHGAILVFFVAYILFKRLYTIKEHVNFRFDYWMIAPIFLTSCIWGVLWSFDVKVGHETFFVLLIQLHLFFLFDRKTAFYLAGPVTLLYFAVPFWEIINQGQLQYMTAVIVSKLVELSGYLVVREGYELMLTVGTFRVDSNCSGMRQIMVSMPIALIFANMQQLGRLSSVIVFLSGVAVAILSNIIRIYIVVLSGQLSNMQHYFVTQDHISLGWTLFAAMFFLYLVVVKWIINRYSLGKERVFEAAVITTGPRKTVEFRAVFMLFAALLPGPVYTFFAHKVPYQFF